MWRVQDIPEFQRGSQYVEWSVKFRAYVQDSTCSQLAQILMWTVLLVPFKTYFTDSCTMSPFLQRTSLCMSKDIMQEEGHRSSVMSKYRSLKHNNHETIGENWEINTKISPFMCFTWTSHGAAGMLRYNGIRKRHSSGEGMCTHTKVHTLLAEYTEI